MNPGDWHAEEWSAFGTCAALLFYVVAGIIAWRQVAESRRLREEQARPYVIVDFEFRQFIAYIGITNIGSNPAYDVRIKFDQLLQASLVPTAGNINDLSVFTEPIPMMAPGRKILISFGSGPDLISRGLPMRYEALVTYRDGRGKAMKPADPACILDLKPFMQAALSPKGMHELVQELNEVRKEMKKWTVSGGRGILTRTIDQRKHQQYEIRPHLRERGRNIRSTDGLVAYLRWQLDHQLTRRGWR